MASKLNREIYNPSIDIYYQNDLSIEFAERIINKIWLKSDEFHNANDFNLVQETKAKVYRMKVNEQFYYLKSYSHRSRSKIIKNFFRSVDAIRCFDNSIRLKNAGIEVAKPILALTMRRNPLLVDSIFVTQEVQGTDLCTYIKNNDNVSDLREMVLKKVALMWSKLVKHNLLHLDPWPGNFIVYPEQGDDFSLKFIDIDNIYSIPYVPKDILILKNLSRLKAKQINTFCATETEIRFFLEEFDKNYNIKNSLGVRYALNQETYK